MTDKTIPTSLLLNEVISIYNALSIVKASTFTAKSTYLCIAMRTRLKPVIDAVEELNKEPERITTYNKEKHKLCTEYALKDAAGDPSLYSKPGSRQGVMSFNIDPERSEEFKKKMKTLNEEYKKDVDDWNDKIEEIKDLLDKPSTELKDGMLSLVNLSWFKADVKADALEALFPILVDDTEGKK
jgi:hypothetical protein